MSEVSTNSPPKGFTIIDKEVVKLVEAERIRTGSKSLAKTAARIIDRHFASRPNSDPHNEALSAT